MPCILRWRFDWEMLILPGVEDWLGEEGRAKRCFKRRVPRGAPCSPVQGLSLHSNQRWDTEPSEPPDTAPEGAARSMCDGCALLDRFPWGRGENPLSV